MIWRRILYLILGLAFALMAYNILKPSAKPAPEWSSINDSLKAQLPSDPEAASRAVKKIVRNLDLIRPSGKYIVIDSHSNHLTYRTEDSVIFRATCSTGSGGVLVDSATGKQWTFNTPRGAFKVQTKIENPWWRKPDWHYIEEKEDIPTDPKQRFDSEVLGDYAMGFGDGYFIHGTLYKRLLGISVTHGCVRLGDEDLKALFKIVPIGTPIYIF